MDAPLFGDVVERLRRSTICIRGASGAAHALGSGVLHSTRGEILTNAHVLRRRGGSESRVTVEMWDGRTVRAALRKIDHGRDLALLEMEPMSSTPDDGEPVAYGDSEGIRAGALAVAVGNPLGFRGAMSAGVFHAPGSPPGPGGRRWVQAALQLAPGNSGGPLADAAGRVVGINTMISGPIAYAVPSRSIRSFLEATPDDPALGVSVEPLIIEEGGRHRFGLRVLEVEPGGAAAEASLRRGDLLFGTEEEEFRAVDDLKDSLARCRAGLRLRFRRGDLRRDRVVTVRPKARTRPSR